MFNHPLDWILINIQSLLCKLHIWWQQWKRKREICCPEYNRMQSNNNSPEHPVEQAAAETATAKSSPLTRNQDGWGWRGNQRHNAAENCNKYISCTFAQPKLINGDTLLLMVCPSSHNLTPLITVLDCLVVPSNHLLISSLCPHLSLFPLCVRFCWAIQSWNRGRILGASHLWSIV